MATGRHFEAPNEYLISHIASNSSIKKSQGNKSGQGAHHSAGSRHANPFQKSPHCRRRNLTDVRDEGSRLLGRDETIQKDSLDTFFSILDIDTLESSTK